MRPIDWFIEAQNRYMQGDIDQAAECLAKSLGGKVNNTIREYLDEMLLPNGKAYKLVLIGITTREKLEK